MIMDEPVRQRLMFFPSSPTPRPVPPPPAKHNKPNTIFCVNSPETSTQSMINATTPELARPNPTQFCSSTKKRFAMGPRADCEKCLAREPGHYGHWL
ncbi:hypothetical protein B0J17DRAFT_650957 [Rhizoctonia solani]|nr:hypothetical protein B0J17DRAFT_650957 [Rhizoctonia solani]